MKYDVIITGVGGQGQVLASRLIGAAAIEAGIPARTGETIGMAQRGGSVVSNVRIGEAGMSPMVPALTADLVIGFEICETARVLGRLKAGGKIVLNDHTVNPVPVSLGLQSYDRTEMFEAIEKTAGSLIVLDAEKFASEAGSVKAGNVVMLGAAAGAGFFPLTKENFQNALKKNLPSKYLSLNLKAFDIGFDYGREYFA